MSWLFILCFSCSFVPIFFFDVNLVFVFDVVFEIVDCLFVGFFFQAEDGFLVGQVTGV